MNTFYGLASKFQLIELAKRVCEVIGNGINNNASILLLETCAAETLLGQINDGTLYGAGAGVSQVDKGTFEWLKSKYKNSSIAQRLLTQLGIDLSKIQYNELDLSPMASLVFCRLRYWTVTEAIPTTISGRADYWKREYNTVAGKGSPEEYIERCESTNVAELIEALAA